MTQGGVIGTPTTETIRAEIDEAGPDLALLVATQAEAVADLMHVTHELEAGRSIPIAQGEAQPVAADPTLRESVAQATRHIGDTTERLRQFRVIRIGSERQL